MNVIIAAAGTGGHINPGIAIANKIKKEHKDAKITFIGTIRGLENDLVPRAGYDLKTIDAYGFNRKLTVSNFKNIIKTLKSFKEAKKIVKDLKPSIVIGTGGYICGPVMMAARKYNIPTVMHESNAFPGVTVKMLANKVNTVLVGFSDAKERLSKAKNVVVTGTPTKFKKVNLKEEEKEKIKKELGIKNNLPIVLIFGGSQGAKSINEALLEMIRKESNKTYQIIWAVGQKQYTNVKEEIDKMGKSIKNIKNTTIMSYIYNMEEVMNLADVIVSRSGAMTITEVAIAEKPAVFIPFPFATENHQEYNARVLEKVGAAKIILDKDLKSEVLEKTLNELVQDKETLSKMGENAKKAKTDNVEEKIYEEIKALIKV